MPGSSTISIHNDFSARYATIGRGTAFAEASSRVYMKGYLGMEPLPQYTRSKMLTYILRDLTLLSFLAVLS